MQKGSMPLHETEALASMGVFTLPQGATEAMLQVEEEDVMALPELMDGDDTVGSGDFGELDELMEALSPSLEINQPSHGKLKRLAKESANRARNDRQSEVAFLRQKMQQMEEELWALRRQHANAVVPVASPVPAATLAYSAQAFGFPAPPTPTPTTGMLPVWDMAARQQRWREKAERENARLKLVLEDQASLARNMEALLQRRIREQTIGCAGTTEGCGPEFLVNPDSFESLLAGLDTAHSELDAVFTINGLDHLETPCCETRIREGSNGMYLDIFAKRMLPFDFETTATAVWNHYRGNLETTADMIMEAVSMKFMGKNTNADFRVKQGLRRYMESDRQVVVWVSKALAAEQQNSPFANFAFVDKGYVVIQRPSSLDLEREDSTLLQICCLISPQTADGSTLDPAMVGAFTEFVLSVMVASITATQELVDHVLHNKALEQQQRERQCLLLKLDAVGSRAAMPLLLHDDEAEALEAALAFVDTFAPSPAVLQQHHTGVAQFPSPHTAILPPQRPAESDEMTGRGELHADEELDRLLLEVGLSSSPPSSPQHRFAVDAPDNMPATPQLSTATHAFQPPVLPATASRALAAAASLGNSGARLRRGSREVAGAMSGKMKRRVRLNPNKARDGRKNELAYLRNKVKQMEEELGALRRQLKGSTEPAGSSSASGMTSNALATPPIWRDMADNQQRRREKAERENARLKLGLESQIKLAKSMETLLQRRTRQQLAGCAALGNTAAFSTQGSALDLILDKDTFEALLAGVETAYGEVDAVLAGNGLNHLETPCTNAQMREGANGMYVDIFTNKLLPFDLETAASAVWGHFRGSEKHRGNLYENFTKSSSDTVAEAFAMELLANDMAADFRIKQVIRRYTEADRQVVVWVSRAQALEQAKAPFSNFGFLEKGYVVIKRPQGHSDFSILQTCCLISPHMTEDGSFDLNAVGAFTEFVLSFMVASITASQQLIENVLLDQSLQQRTRNPSCP
ncbi:hypothetical protein BBJ28_00010355 [Nothophytophthora sp. Chile5]|nr:hypothetical protein BBJ28_00010355 [Nothophytophthora sp. Chile5]